ncbi:hypothetical protein SAMN05444422_11812 [Halobiforma haloterrestris]|uniref:Uncharacterized protein n=2 Tax=Natronobacterium haloterrestre TaxID=148448 RepID=A0A1I1LKA7_NATHA|nr:hypothetical protein SAMN05444422_11812 [Halobiforma haloterrestris]
MIVGSGTVAAIALSGYTGAATDADDDRPSLPSDLESVLELVPGESALDANYRHVVYSRVDDAGSAPLYLGGHEVIGELDIDADSIAEMLVVVTDDETRLSVVAGEFDAPDVGDDADLDGWTVGEVDDEPVAAAEGALVIATGDDGDEIVDAALEAADDEDTETILADPETAGTTFDRLESKSYVTFVPDVSEVRHNEFDGDVVEAFGMGLESAPMARDDDSDTLENDYVLHLDPDAGTDVDDEWIVDRVESIGRGEILESSIDRSDDVVYVQTVVEQPPERDREAAPDARVRARSNADEGVVTFEHAGGEPIETDSLEVWHDGELADDQLADEHATFTEGDTFELETGPLADVGLRWFDEEADVYYYYDTTVVGTESFDGQYDPDEETVEFTYTGDLEADSDLVELVHRSDDDGSYELDRGAIDVDGPLTDGETITVEDVTLGDRVSLELSVPANPNRGQRSLSYVRVRPPRMHLSRREGTVVARYWGDIDRDADEFRVLVEDEPADVQFSDVTDTLSEHDRVELGEMDHGTHVAVEWLEPDDPVVVTERVLRPYARIDMDYDDSEGTVTADYEEGEEIDADDLELRIADEPAAVQPADEYETFAPGDDLTVEADPFATVELVWEGGDDTEYGLGRVTVGRRAFDAEYDPDADEVEIVYTGEQSADPSNLTVSQRGGGSSIDDEDLFAQEYDSLTDGDSIVLEDVEIDDRISVMLVQEGENYSSRSSIFRFTPEPRWAFSVEDRGSEDGDGDEDGLVAVYHERTTRDADNFEILVDGEPADVQPSDRHDTLTAEDEIELGEFDAGTELSFRWLVPDEPREVRNHVVVPDAEFEVDYDADDDEITVEHAGGDGIDAADLAVIVEPLSPEPTDWDGDGTVSEGDSTTVDVDDLDSRRDRDPAAVGILFRDHHLTHVRIDD